MEILYMYKKGTIYVEEKCECWTHYIRKDGKCRFRNSYKKNQIIHFRGTYFYSMKNRENWEMNLV